MGANTNPVAAPEPSTLDSPTIDTALGQFADHGFIHHHTAPTAGRSRAGWQANLDPEFRSIEEELLRN